MRLFECLAIAIVSLIVANLPASAADLIVTNPQKSAMDKRFEYPLVILEEALRRGTAGRETFEIERYPESVTRNRALQLLKEGKISVFSSPTREEWEETAVPIRIPIRKGLLGYRLFLINADDQSIFSNIQSIEDLKAMPVGGGTQWSTSKALRQLGFKLTGVAEYEPLFAMLKHRRFTYFPRGINEIFRELEDRKDIYPNMKIEDDLALYMPLPTYFFVTPTRPDIAVWLRQGMLEIVQDGTLDQYFYEYHQDALDRARLSDRRVFVLENPGLSSETPFDEKRFWYSPPEQ